MKSAKYKALIKRCIARDASAQKKMYDLFSGKMFAICLRYSPDYHTAEDILQEGFIKVFKNIAKFRHEGSFEGWVRRIFVNTAIEHYRRSTPMYPLLEVAQSPKQIVDDQTLASLAAQDLMKLVQNLSPGYRTIFNLYVIEGYAHKEIAEMLSISEGTSKSQLARARYILQEKVRLLNPTSTKITYVERA